MKTETIIRENGYTAVWTKEPTGDKPWKQAIISDSLKELRQIAAQHGGEVHFLRRREGHRIYEDKGILRADNLTQVTLPESFNGLYTTWEQAEIDIEQFLLKGFDNWGLFLAYHAPNANIEESLDILKRLWVLGEQMTAFVDQEEPTLIAVDEDQMQVVFATTADCTEYSFDTWEFQLGVVIKN